MANYNRAVLLLSVAALCYGVMATEFYYEDRTAETTTTAEREDRFLLQDSKHVIKTDAGDVRVVKTYGGKLIDRPMHIGFITMEPKSLFVPQYLDSSLILFIRRGEARIGLIYKDELAERRLKIGDVYRIPAGSAFYLINTGEGQRLHVVCSIDPSESLGLGLFQSFFLGGGTYPTSVLAGFEPETLSTAFNVTIDELKDVMGSQRQGPIIYIDDSRAPRIWRSFIKMEEQEKLNHLKKMMPTFQIVEEEENIASWSWRKLLQSVIGREKKRETKGKSPDSYNLYKRSPDFRNNYGSSVALDESSYDPLKNSGIGVYLVNLTGGSMMAPHVNPTATEYGIVLRGSGIIQIVYPNGTQAMNTKVKEGDVFMVPRYFPFCQIASRTGPFEFFGFTTSARRNRPQFLAGANSLLSNIGGPELAAAFGTTEGRLRGFVDAQREAVILPSASAAPPDKVVKKGIDGFGKNDI
ncbi:vicilin-like seed storage protein At2g28490 [Euphorbia lathyris]|uniref:vicilin-like seed storage protein At2g28490 n=1 Tax=Euphorbia lathyris TaxID=212925 RepID=UPI0033137F8C